LHSSQAFIQTNKLSNLKHSQLSMLLFADNVSFTEFEMPGLPLTDYIIYCCASYRLFL